VHSVDEWRFLHKFEKDILESILSGLHSGTLMRLPEAFRSASSGVVADTPVLPSRGICLDACIKPAFSQYFHTFLDFAAAMAGIEFHDDPYVNMPHTQDGGPECDPVVVMTWKNKPEDLICLAHEVAHALQINLSAHVFMPPVAREACAFLGELILLDWCQNHDRLLYSHLLGAWLKDNTRYLGEDAENLAAEMLMPIAPYRYRMNYPLARIMAVYLFENRTPTQVHDLFSSGSDAMSLLPYDQLARTATERAGFQPNPQGRNRMCASGTQKAVKQKELSI